MRGLSWTVLGLVLGRASVAGVPATTRPISAPSPSLVGRVAGPLDPNHLDPEDIEQQISAARRDFWGTGAFAVLGAVGVVLVVGVLAGAIARPTANSDINMSVVVATLRSWFGGAGLSTVYFAATVAILAANSGINIAIANASARAETFVTVSDAVASGIWYSMMRRFASVAAMSSLALSIVTAPAVSSQSIGLVALLGVFSLASIVLAAACRGRAETAIDQVRSRAFDRRRLQQIAVRTALLNRAIDKVQPVRRFAWSSLRTIISRAAAIAGVESAPLLVVGIRSAINHPLWRPALGVVLFFGLLLLINVFVAALAVERWSDLSRRRRWFGVSWSAPLLRLLAVALAVELCREAMVYPGHGSNWAAALVLLAAVPLWWSSWRSSPRRSKTAGRVARWLGEPAWRTVVADLKFQRNRILDRYSDSPLAEEMERIDVR